MKLSLIIPIAESDVGALLNNLSYIKENIICDKIFVIGQGTLRHRFENKNVTFIDEDTLYPGLTFNKVREIIYKINPKAVRRTGWYFQQFLKLAFALKLDGGYYLTWDSDTIPLKKIDFFNNSGIPFLDCRPYVVEDEPYFQTIENIWKDGNVKKKDYNSYISEHMVFSSNIVKEMINEIECKEDIAGNLFYEKILNSIPVTELNLSGFSEFETYASYLICKHTGEFELRRWKNLRHGKVYFGANPTAVQFEWASKTYDVVSIEDFDKQWLICKFLCNKKEISKRSFSEVSNFVEPKIAFIYKWRLKIRELVRR